jgi:hypothetical protein
MDNLRIWVILLHAKFCMVSLLGIDWADYKKQLKKGEQWNVEVY